MTKIRKSLSRDATSVAQVLRSSITELCYDDHQDRQHILEPWLANKTPEFVNTWISAPDAYCVTALTESDEIIGFGMLNRTGKMLLLYVKPDHVGTGAGHALLQAIEDRARSWGLAEVSLDSTVTARSFYQRHGYLDSDSCKSRSDGLNCHAMHKPLDT